MENNNPILRVSYKQYFVICLVVSLALLLSLLYFQMRTNKPDEAAQDEVMVQDPGITIDNSVVKSDDNAKDPFAGRYITYQGLSDLYATEGIIYQFQNPNAQRDVYMTFTISEGDKQLVTTDFVPAGMAHEVEFADILSKGDHELTVLMQPYIKVSDKYLACPVNNVQNMKVTVD